MNTFICMNKDCDRALEPISLEATTFCCICGEVVEPYREMYTIDSRFKDRKSVVILKWWGELFYVDHKALINNSKLVTPKVLRIHEFRIRDIYLEARKRRINSASK